MRPVVSVFFLTVLGGGCIVETSDTSTQSSDLSAEQKALIESTRASIAARGITAVPNAPHVRSALVRLGRALFHDKLLSGNRELSCATCHPTRFGSDDDRHLSLGVTGVGLGTERTG